MRICVVGAPAQMRHTLHFANIFVYNDCYTYVTHGDVFDKTGGAHPRGRAIIVRMGNDLQTHLSPFHKDSFSTTHGADAPDLCL